MDLQGVQIQNYIYHFFKAVLQDYPIDGKNVMFLHNSYLNINTAKALLNFGAKKVYFITCSEDNNVSDDENIEIYNLEDIEQLKNIEDNSIDIAIGLEILEHVFDIELLSAELKRVLKFGATAILHGYPMWTSRFGHHLWIEDKFYFNTSKNPLMPWEHLTLMTRQDVMTTMEKYGYDEKDGNLVIDWLFGGKEINRYSPSEIFEKITNIPYAAEKFGRKSNNNKITDTYQTEDFSYVFERLLETEKPNRFYSKALAKYSEDDLNAEECNIIITKKRPKNPDDTNDFSELPHFRRVVFEDFFKKYNLKDANVLNISYYDNNLFSKILKNNGAKTVTGVSPRLNFENNEEIDSIKNIGTDFENLAIPPEKFDIIIGFDVIQKIKNFNKFCNSLKKYSNYSTAVHIDGYMPYTSACGHSLCSENHKFFDETNPLDYWEHLSINNEADFREALKRHNIADEEINGLIYEFSDENFVFKMSPTEIEERISKDFVLDVRRIYKFYPKNEYYFKALEKYSEDDLNVERLIITSDIPSLLWLDDLNMDKNYELNVSDINLKYKLPKKRVLSISPNYCNYAMTEGLESLRAEEVVSLCAYDSGYELRGGKNVKRVNQKFEDVANLCGKFDVIYGIEILEHIKDMKGFFENLKNLVADNGVICLQGRPLWTSDDGHNATFATETGYLQMGEEDGKISPWQHLAFETKDELKESLLKKKFNEYDAEKIADYVFNSDEINRLSYAKILDILNSVDGVYYGSKKVLDYSEENEFYEKASKKYTHEELRTKELSLSIRKKL